MSSHQPPHQSPAHETLRTRRDLLKTVTGGAILLATGERSAPGFPAPAKKLPVAGTFQEAWISDRADD